MEVGGSSMSGGRGLGFGLGLRRMGGGAGAGSTSIGGGKGESCWLRAGAVGGCGGLAFAFGCGRRGPRTGGGFEDAASGFAGKPAVEGGAGSPRSKASSRLVSRSIARTASQDDKADTSTLRLSASGGPAANRRISG